MRDVKTDEQRDEHAHCRHHVITYSKPPHLNHLLLEASSMRPGSLSTA
jgi:hypothetical protein